MSVEHAFQQGWSGVQRRAIYLELLEFGVTLQRTLLFFYFYKRRISLGSFTNFSVSGVTTASILLRSGWAAARLTRCDDE